MKITLLTGQTFDFSKHLGFEVKVVKSPLAKRLTLRIDERKRQPVLTVPRYCSQTKALKFLDEHRDWIINMLARLPVISGFANGSIFSFFTKQYTVRHNPDQRGTFFDRDYLKVGGKPEFLHRRVTDFLKEQTLKQLSERTVQKAKLLNCPVASVSVKDTKSRWGSCSTLKNINYNWRICFAPEYVIDYLVCHEVSHLKHPDHSADFWTTVKELCPNCEDGRHWLKVKGKDLYKYF